MHRDAARFVTAIDPTRLARAIARVVLTTVLACSPDTSAQGYEVLGRLAHDSTAYTQGLLAHDGVLYESTGLHGQSQLRRVDRQTGRVLAAVPLAADRFGEGLALLDGRLHQLTWQHGTGYIYDLTTLARVDSFAYTGEGWGLTTDGAHLIMSDGTATLRFLDPATFAVARSLEVRDGSSPLSKLNELEYVRGEILANVYPSSWIVRIDPETGQVRGWLDMAGLVPEALRASETDVLNGIAYDAASDEVLVTGKRWPVLYRLRLPAPSSADRPAAP